VFIQFQAVTINSEDSTIPVGNQILSNNNSPLLSAMYRNGEIDYISPCNNCTFTGNAATGNLSIKLENLQPSNAGTYKLTVTQATREFKECVVVYVLGKSKSKTIEVVT
jgi:hypothetical protein